MEAKTEKNEAAKKATSRKTAREKAYADLPYAPPTIHRILAEFAGHKIFENISEDIRQRIYFAMFAMRPFKKEQRNDLINIKKLISFLDNAGPPKESVSLAGIFKSISSIKAVTTPGNVPALIVDDLIGATNAFKDNTMSIDVFEFSDSASPSGEFLSELEALETRRAKELLDSTSGKGLTYGYLKKALRQDPFYGICATGKYELNYNGVISSFGNSIKQLNTTEPNSRYIWTAEGKPRAYQ